MRDLLTPFVTAWMRWWFEAPEIRGLELVRAGLGFAMLVSFAAQAYCLFDLYTDAGWVSLAELKAHRNPWRWSLLFYLTTPWQVRLAWLAAVVGSAAFMVGWKTAWVKWPLWVLHTSFCNRAPYSMYGMDDIAAVLLLLLCLAPIGRSRLPAPDSAEYARASAITRLIQIQMAIVFFFSGAEKLRGSQWWHGDAVWFALTDIEFHIWPLAPLASRLWLINAMTYGSVLVELAYPFRIWDDNTRPYLLVAAIGLHVGIGVMMGLVQFAIAMIAGHLIFTPSGWIDQLRWLLRSLGSTNGTTGLDRGGRGPRTDLEP